jgi:hypothetical protein
MDCDPPRLELFLLEYRSRPVARRLAPNGRIPTFDVCARLLPAAKASVSVREELGWENRSSQLVSL